MEEAVAIEAEVAAVAVAMEGAFVADGEEEVVVVVEVEKSLFIRLSSFLSL